MKRYDVLEMIKESGGSISGEEMSGRLGVSRAMIWKNIRRLREEGYPISAGTNRGYRIEPGYDVLNEYEAGANPLGGSLIYVRETGSTNSLLKEMAVNKELREGTCLFCDRQTKGRGRLGREWYSPEGRNIAMSLLLKPAVSPADAGGFPLLAGVCVYEALKALSGADLSIKWPNDILLNGRKVCGILTDMVTEMEKVDFIVVGIGINVRGRSAGMPKDLAETAATLEEHSLPHGKLPRRALIIRRILESFSFEYPKNRDGITDELIDKWKAYSGAAGRKIEYHINNEKKTGTIVDVMKNGALTVKTRDGKDTVHSGMIVEIEGRDDLV